MKCEKCDSNAIIENPVLCKEHFTEYFESKVKETIEEHGLIEKNDRICVAASGGKDSLTLLYLLKKFGYNVEALAINEGIHSYRDKTLGFLKSFCETQNISLRIVSYKEETGKRLDEIIPEGKPACNACGTIRRNLLNKYSQEYDKLATGHNLDDESQAILMNLLKAQTKLFARQGPKTIKTKGFTQKIKPLYFLKEKEVMVYSYINNLNTEFTECPFAKYSYRAYLRDLLNEQEKNNPGTKMNIVNKYLKERKKVLSSTDKKTALFCIECGSPAAGNTCKACKLKKSIAGHA